MSNLIIHNCRIDFYNADKVSLQFKHADITTKYCDEANAFIAQNWEKALYARHELGINLFNGSLYRLTDWQLSRKGLQLFTENTDYRSYVATRISDFPVRFSGLSLADPLAVCVALVSDDNYIIMEQRKGTDTGCGRQHVIGGFVDRDHDMADSHPVAPVSAIVREVWEELRLQLPVGNINFLGLLYDQSIPHPELCFSTVITETLSSLQADLILQPTEEIEQVFGIKNQPDELFKYLLNKPNVTATAYGCLLLHGRNCFGEAWYQDVLTEYHQRQVEI